MTATTPGPAALRLKKWMGFTGVLYALSGAAFALAPDLVMESIHISTRLLGLQDTPASTERFWLTLACSMMMMLVVCCALVSRDVVNNQQLCVPVIFSKFTSTILGTLYFVLGNHHGAMVMIGVSDLPLGIVTWVLWNQARKNA